MEFLMAMLLYLLAGMLCVVAYQHQDSRLLTTGPLGKVREQLSRILQQLAQFLPDVLRRDLWLVAEYLFFSRNRLFQALYVALLAAAHAVIAVDILPHLYAVDFDANHTLVPMVLLVANVILFVVCSCSDAGEISHANVDRYVKVFPADGELYRDGAVCRTCQLPKPARSKHCAIYDKCIFKFDHYCAWTNNCVGGLNHRYFFGYLATISAMCVNGVVMATKALVSITMRYQLLALRYVDDHGKPQPMTFRVLIQTLFMRYPRIVFFIAGVTVLGLVMVGFTCYHAYQILTNQTTNERYKKHYLKKAKRPVPFNVYHRGVTANLLEEFFPQHCVENAQKVTHLHTKTKNNEVNSRQNGVRSPNKKGR